jgi:two-component system, NarL family, response regulator NreC
MPTNLRLAPPISDAGGPSSADPIRIVLADDHEALRRSLRRLLDTEHEIAITAEASELEMAKRDVRRHSPHVLILGLRLPNGSALATIRAFRHKAPTTQIVLLTMEISPAFAEQALRAGALGYVLKEHADRDLPAAIRCAARGESYVTPEVAMLDALPAARQLRPPTSR